MSKQPEKNYQKILEDFYNLYPKFKDGRIDYSLSDSALVIDVVVVYKDEFLLLKRSNKVRTYRGLWMVPAGYMDEIISAEEKALKELFEETGIEKKSVLSIKTGKLIKETDSKISKIWYIIPVLIKLKHKPKIRLDWEHTEYKWVKYEDLKNYKTVPGLNGMLKNILDKK